MPEIDGVDISDIEVSLMEDPHRKVGDLTPEQALDVVRRRLQQVS